MGQALLFIIPQKAIALNLSKMKLCMDIMAFLVYRALLRSLFQPTTLTPAAHRVFT